jgi:ribosome maturation factor RimP
LKSPQHFAASVGKEVVVKTTERLHRDSHRIDGVIAGAEENEIVVRSGDQEVRVPYTAIKTARTVFEWR